jgi:periplasmic protein TonB
MERFPVSTSASKFIRSKDGAKNEAAKAATSTPVRVEIEVIAVTKRDDFLIELGKALDGQASVSPVESITAALAQITQGKRLQVLMVDSRDIENLRTEIDIAQEQASDVPVLIFAASDSQQQTSGELKGSSVFAVLPLPVDPMKTAAIFEGAIADHEAKQDAKRQEKSRTASRAAVAAEIPSEKPIQNQQFDIRPAFRHSAPERKSPTPGIAIGAGAALLLAVVAFWFFTKKDSTSPLQKQADTVKATPVPKAEPVAVAPAAPQPVLPVVETSVVQGQVDELLEKARLAMRERRYTEPSGNNALVYYRSAAAADPSNSEALDGLNRVGGVLVKRFDEALRSNKLDEAGGALANFKTIAANDPRANMLQGKLNQANRLRAEAIRQQEQVLREKRAAEQAARVAAAEQAAREAADAEKKRIEEQARVAAARAAQRAPVPASTDSEAAVSQAVPVPKPTTAAPTANVTGSSLQKLLKLKRYQAPDYPPEAAARGIGGVVTVSFTVDVSGTTRDIKVEASNPEKLFDRAAVAAVRRWRYEPVEVNGVPTEVPTRLAIRFTPPTQ